MAIIVTCRIDTPNVVGFLLMIHMIVQIRCGNTFCYTINHFKAWEHKFGFILIRRDICVERGEIEFPNVEQSILKLINTFYNDIEVFLNEKLYIYTLQ